MSKKRFGLFSAGLLTASAMLLATDASPGSAQQPGGAVEPITQGGPTTFRRLNEDQYKRAIADIFGTAIKVPGRFDPPLREAGLLAIGDGKVTVSASGIEQYELRSREIAAQVLSESGRKTALTCSPKDVKAFDRACAAQFLTKYGTLLYRRPMDKAELALAMNVAASTASLSGNFYDGLQAGLGHLLASPNFIFRLETMVRDPRTGAMRLDDYSLASRLSYLLWDASPDQALLDAAARGELRTQNGVNQQVDRMIASPRFEVGVRAFFSDMLGYDQFEGLSKDQAIYPKFNSQVAKDAREQSLRTIVDLLVEQKGDYRDLFVTKKTFMNRNLAALYRVPVSANADLTNWVPYTFSDNDPRSGILTLVGFLMLDATHEGRSSPTVRGKTVRELLLCQTVPTPPPNVDFKVVQDVQSKEHPTARDRLAAHQENPVCAGCHALTDPIGLSMEKYDASGAFRTHENGALIDTSGKFEGKTYSDVIGFQKILHGSETAPSCVAKRAFEYGVGRSVNTPEDKWMAYTTQAFAANGYRFPALIRTIATSQAFRAVSGTEVATTNSRASINFRRSR